MSYTYAILEVSAAAFEEIRAKLERAGYDGQFETDDCGSAVLIDMHGIAIQAEQAPGSSVIIIAAEDAL